MVTLANLSHRCLGILKNKSSSLVLSLWGWRCLPKKKKTSETPLAKAPLKRVLWWMHVFFFCGDAMFNLNVSFCWNPWNICSSLIFRVQVLKSRESWTWGCSYTRHRKLHSASSFAKKRVSCFWKNLSNRRHTVYAYTVISIFTPTCTIQSQPFKFIR